MRRERVKREKEEEFRGVCPKCGAPYRSLIVQEAGGRLYVYAYHGREGGRAVRCYLGPAEGYVAVSRVKQSDLAGLHEEGLAEVVSLLSAIYFRLRREADYKERLEERAEHWRAVVEGLEHVAEVVKRYLEEARRQHELWRREAARERERELALLEQE